jgi:hypothetical protein
VIVRILELKKDKFRVISTTVETDVTYEMVALDRMELRWPIPHFRITKNGFATHVGISEGGDERVLRVPLTTSLPVRKRDYFRVNTLDLHIEEFFHTQALKIGPVKP